MIDWLEQSACNAGNTGSILVPDNSCLGFLSRPLAHNYFSAILMHYGPGVRTSEQCEKMKKGNSKRSCIVLHVCYCMVGLYRLRRIYKVHVNRLAYQHPTHLASTNSIDSVNSPQIETSTRNANITAITKRFKFILTSFYTVSAQLVEAQI